MPLLHLLRHAKSSRDEQVEDHQRPLSRRGRDVAHLVGRRLPAAVGRLDLVLCSSALRTRETLALVLAGFDPRPRIAFEDGLYLASATRLMNRLRRLAPQDAEILLIGHNPGLHDLAIMLAAADSPDYRALAAGKFPTAARASLRISSPWPALDRGGHELVAYVAPQSLGGAED